MKKIFALSIVAAMAAMSCNETAKNDAEKSATSDSVATASTPPAPAEKVDSATMMQRWMEYMTPGSVHKMFAAMDGNWETDMSMWMDPAAPPTTGKGKCVNRMTMGGRYHESHHTSSFDGMPFEGLATMAYDNAKKLVISSWIDNMGTGMSVLEGPYDSTTRTVTLSGKMMDPVSGKDKQVRQIMHYTDDKHITMEMWETGADGKEFKNMEMKMVKK